MLEQGLEAHERVPRPGVIPRHDQVVAGAIDHESAHPPRHGDPSGRIGPFQVIHDERSARNLRDEAAGVLRTLTPAEEKVIRMRFGIGYDREYTLQEIAGDFGLTRERIRQIEGKALQKLRSSENTRRLHPLMTIQ